ncbi:hypothetical protein CO051_04430 [Candidatus Roizmanbacteria bacterium CG_4_9_14_0_2_um_filter_39_13]|uniref:Uncharacterized protein n=1 Tax=Candidatus Roizmanbacteria bacterium CG_4_9_14_0_2_um_filter_39_13 TaxID=1974839 RepID=A0A2M8EXY8_9BACT|nr:MAG: hypothetical protein CO051_04430 [Candidatus Roizmanbacteria bacterium CG_4_9_14_0_2_um_filter_39_13]
MSRSQKILLLVVLVLFSIVSLLLYTYLNERNHNIENRSSRIPTPLQSTIKSFPLFPSSNIELKNETNYEVSVDLSLVKSLFLENAPDFAVMTFPKIIIHILDNPSDQRINYRIQNGSNGYYMGYGSEIITDDSLILYVYADDENVDKFTSRLNYALVSSIFLVRFPYKSVSDLESTISDYYQHNFKNKSMFTLR